MIQVDGGIKLENYKDVIAAGGDILVAGSQVFQSENPIETINTMYSKWLIILLTDFNKLNDKQKDLHTVNIIKGLVWMESEMLIQDIRAVQCL